MDFILSITAVITMNHSATFNRIGTIRKAISHPFKAAIKIIISLNINLFRWFKMNWTSTAVQGSSVI